jgi:hypothetical protein
VSVRGGPLAPGGDPAHRPPVVPGGIVFAAIYQLPTDDRTN